MLAKSKQESTHEEAIADYGRAIHLKSDYADAYYQSRPMRRTD